MGWSRLGGPATGRELSLHPFIRARVAEPRLAHMRDLCLSHENLDFPLAKLVHVRRDLCPVPPATAGTRINNPSLPEGLRGTWVAWSFSVCCTGRDLGD